MGVAKPDAGHLPNGPAECAVHHQKCTENAMSFSVNTNVGSMTALQYLNQTQGQLNQTQEAINSGLKVADAKDNGAIYAIAQNQRGSVAGYQSVLNSLNNGSSSIDVALSAGQSISDLLIQLKQQALSAADPSLDTASRQALNANFTALRDQITTIVKNAVFNNFNLVNGSTNMIQALASSDGTRRITTQAQNLSLSGSIVTIKSTATISTQAKASALIATIQTSLTNVNGALAKLSAGAAKFSIQATFTQKLSDTLTQGIGNLVDANMAQESASLQSLQVKQQLGIQALSIANQAPQSILSLFK
jgi:flagellin